MNPPWSTVNLTSVYLSDGNLLTSSDIGQYTINCNPMSPFSQINNSVIINNSAIKTKLLSDFIKALSIMDDESIMADEIEQTIHLWATLNKVT